MNRKQAPVKRLFFSRELRAVRLYVLLANVENSPLLRCRSEAGEYNRGKKRRPEARVLCNSSEMLNYLCNG